MIRARESTENVPSTRRKKDISQTIHKLDPDAAPFTLMLTKANNSPCHDPQYFWQEKELPPKWDQVNDADNLVAGDTALVVDNAKYFSVGDIVNVVRTGEKIRVTAVATSTNTLTVVRGVGNTAAAGINNNDDLQIIGSAYAEGSPLGLEKSHVETQKYNYTQIFRTPYGATGTMEATETYTPKPMQALKGEKSIEHRIDMERSLLFGERNIDTTSTNNPRRYTGGLLFYLADNIKDFAGPITTAGLWSWLQDVYSHTAGGDNRTLFASGLIITQFDQLAIAQARVVPGDKVWGLSVTQFLTSHGTFNIVRHRLLDNGVGGQGYGGYGFLVNPKMIAKRHLPGRDTFHRPNVGADGDDGWTNEYLTECGWEVRQSKLHGIAKGVTV